MNWTGGSLQRHSRNAQKGVAMRQKEHFAKARTALQNGPSAPSAPFRPSYLADEDVSLGGRLPPFGSGSVRHTGHSRRLQMQHESEEAPRHRELHPAVRNDAEQLAKAATTGESRAAPHGPPTNNRDGSENTARQASFDATEYRLLEANRRRLLDQQDWVGLAPSRPARMHFTSIREKDRIGKRRRIARHVRQQTSNEATMSRQPQYPTYDEHSGPYTTGPTRKHVEDIRIRIGSDALASQTPMEQTDRAHSQQAETFRDSSPDSMLFDHEVQYSAPKESKPAPPSVSSNRSTPAASTTDQHIRSNQSARPSGNTPLHEHWNHQVFPEQGESSHNGANGENGERWMRPNRLPERNTADRDEMLRKPVGKHVPADLARPQDDAIGSSFQVFGGVGHQALRLIFDNLSDPVEFGGVDDAAAVASDCIDDASAYRQANAGFPNFGHAQPRDCVGRGMSSKAHEPWIVDEGRWRTFVDIPEFSSSRSTTTLSHTSQQPAKKDALKYGSTAWSQHATVGEQTCNGVSSPISASLPSVKRIDDRGTLGYASHSGGKKGRSTSSGRQSHGIDESERLWRTFVFEDHDKAISENTTRHENRTEAGRVTPSSKRGSDMSPSCAAVASSTRSSSNLFDDF